MTKERRKRTRARTPLTKFRVYGPYILGGTGPDDAFEEALLTWSDQEWHAHPAQGDDWFNLDVDTTDGWTALQQHPDFPTKKRARDLMELSKGKGVYIFTIQTRGGRRPVMRPIYVGMTRAQNMGFQKEAFSSSTLGKVTRALNRQRVRRGTLRIYFIAGRGGRGRIPAKRIQNMETYLIGLFHHHGLRLVNDKKRPGQSPESKWTIEGLPLPWSIRRGRRPQNVMDLLKMARQ